jgi:hypothetical protein
MKEYIAGLLRLRVSPEHIVSAYFVHTPFLIKPLQLQLVHRGVYDSDDIFNHDMDKTSVASQSEFIQLRDIRRIEKDIEAETVHLHPDDGQSTIRWVENLRVKGHLLGFKSRMDPPLLTRGKLPFVDVGVPFPLPLVSILIYLPFHFRS